MTALVSSDFVVGPAQADGRCYVKEKHVTDDAQEFEYEYLCDTDVTPPNVVCAERAVVINATLARRDAARALVIGTSVPLTRFEFLNRFTPQERMATRVAAKSDLVVEDFMALMEQASNIALPIARPGLQYLAMLGVLSAERAAEIGAE